MDIGYSSMIEKIRSIQDSWFMKAILVLTALSFMSLFGISGYIGSAAQDKSVIEVDDIAISQAQILQQLNRELQTARKLFGEDIEVNDSIRMALLQNIIQKELSNAIIRKTAQDNHVVISDTLVSKIIAAMPEFRGVDGKFNPEQMRMVLSNAGFSESMYINQLKEDMSPYQKGLYLKLYFLLYRSLRFINLIPLFLPLTTDIHFQHNLPTSYASWHN